MIYFSIPHAKNTLLHFNREARKCHYHRSHTISWHHEEETLEHKDTWRHEEETLVHKDAWHHDKMTLEHKDA